MPEDTSRLSAALLLARLQSLRSTIEGAAGRVGGTAAELHLAAILDQVAGAEGEVSQALQSGGRISIDLTAIERLLAGSEAAISTAIAAGSAEASSKAAQDIAATYEATRHEVQDLSRDLFERRIFDADLKFRSAEEETAYRAREAERQKQIAELLAQQTPEGDLQAGGLAAGQMLDAGGHGATSNPDFMPRWNRLVEQLHRQRAALVSERRDPEVTARFDQQVRRDIRQSLQHMGVPADQIERVIAAEDPLRAATPFLSRDSASALEARLQRNADLPMPGPTESPAPQPAGKPIVARVSVAAIVQGADLAAIGVTAAPPLSDASPSTDAGNGHGLSDQARPPLGNPAARIPD